MCVCVCVFVCVGGGGVGFNSGGSASQPGTSTILAHSRATGRSKVQRPRVWACSEADTNVFNFNSPSGCC